MTRPLLPFSSTTEAVQETASAFHADIVQAVIDTVGRDDVVVVGMKQNPFVAKARKALTDAGFTYAYLEYGSYLSQWKQRLAIKLWSGWPTYPQVFVRGTLIGGHAETQQAIEDGSLRAMLDADRTA